MTKTAIKIIRHRRFYLLERLRDIAAQMNLPMCEIKKALKLLALMALAFSMNSCASFRTSYQNCPFTPDSVNYTLERDRNTGELSDYFGASWQLKH